MLLKKKIIPAMLGVFVSLGLVACGSDSTSTVGVGGATTTGGTTGSGTTGGTPTGSSATDARTIVLSYPYESVENLENGFYRRQGAAIVTDNEGNPVPDGTEVYLNLIDSIIAKGTISSDDGDSIVDNVLTDNNPTSADGTATPLDSAYVIRNEAQIFINSNDDNDHLFLKGANSSFDANNLPNSEPEDKNRIISSITANTITVEQDYSVDYPNSIYGSGVTDYIVGASLLGAEVQGVEFDADGNEVLINEGKSITKGGVAKFYVTYPANRREINTGCISSGIDDTRSWPLGSADVVLVASAGSKAITLDDRFCFTPMAPFTLTHEPDFALAAGGSGSWTATVTLEDATRIRVPFEEVWAYAAVDNTGLTITSITFSGGGETGFTGTSGQTQVTVTASATKANETTGEEGAVGATGTITVRAGDASTEITLTVY